MSDSEHQSPGSPEDGGQVRCPACDFVLQPDSERCLMCGTEIDPALFGSEVKSDIERVTQTEEPAENRDELDVDSPERLLPWQADSADLEKVDSNLLAGSKVEQGKPKTVPFTRASKSEPVLSEPNRPKIAESLPALSPRFAVALFAALFTAIIGFYVFRNPGTLPIVLIASPTPLPTTDNAQSLAALPLESESETATSLPTEPRLDQAELTPSASPTVTPTPLPTETPLPPREHRLESGQTLVGLAFLYQITQASIEAVNGLTAESTLFEGQTILIPWPTPTPPLAPLAIRFGAETIVVEPNCPPFYEIEEGDSLAALAARNGLPVEAVLEMNYLTETSIVRPGDQICVPQLVEGLILVPTPGPSPTPAPTHTPAGPRPLYPQNEASFPADGNVLLQWLSVDNLGADQWYMAEIVDLTDVSRPPLRAFTKSNSVQLDPAWQSADGAAHRYRWQISLVRETGQRADGSLIYTYGGPVSPPRVFSWGN